MPVRNSFWLDDDQNVAPCWPKPAEQNPKHPAVDSHPGARMFSLERTYLLAQGNDFKTEVAAGTEKGTEASEKTNDKWSHEPGFIS